MGLYGFTDFPDAILFHFKVVAGDLKPINLYKLGINVPKIAKTKLFNFYKPLPLTVDYRDYGIPLIPHFDENNSIISFKMPDYLGGAFV